MADYTVYVNSSSFTKDAPYPTGTEITPQNPLGVNAGQTVAFVLGDGRTTATSVEVAPGTPPLFRPPNDTGFTVPTDPNGITLNVAGGPATGKDYTLSVPSTKRNGFTGGIKVNN